jgi:hypothetical protein
MFRFNCSFFDMFRTSKCHPQKDLYVQFYGISVMHPYNQSGRWQDVLHQTYSAIAQTAYMDA